MNYNVLLIDDEPKANEVLKDLLNAYSDFTIHTCTSAKGALRLLCKNRFDLLFLDINMPEITGLELAKYMTGIKGALPVVFVSAYDKFMPQAFKVQPFDFLTKPVDTKELAETVERFKEQYPHANTGFTLCTQRGYERIKYCSLLYICTERRKIKLQTLDGDSIYVNDMTLSSMKEILPQNFVQVHKQTIVNMEYARILKEGEIKLSGNKGLAIIIPVGKTFRTEVSQRFFSYNHLI